MRALFADQLFERIDVHVPLERGLCLGVGGLAARQIYGAGAGELDIRARRVEMRVVRHDMARLAHHAEEDAFGRATLVRGDDVPEAREVLHRRLEPQKALAAGVGLVSAHQRRPLRGGHGAGAGIG